MQTIVLFTAVPLLLYLWATTNPQKAKALVAELKRRWRLTLIKRYGERGAEEFFQEIYRLAERQDIDKDFVEKWIQKHRDEVINRTGTKEANRRLGHPTPLERWY